MLWASELEEFVFSAVVGAVWSSMPIRGTGARASGLATSTAVTTTAIRAAVHAVRAVRATAEACKAPRRQRSLLLRPATIVVRSEGQERRGRKCRRHAGYQSKKQCQGKVTNCSKGKKSNWRRSKERPENPLRYRGVHWQKVQRMARWKLARKVLGSAGKIV